jgi:cellulose synthase/poly-beta-1,6-N-acetylglucosamine synthase-like glycosyltransferase
MLEVLCFWLPLGLLIHSYILYPLILQVLAHKKRNNEITYNQGDDLPCISILISAYNEEKYIEQRIHNIYTTNYPIAKIEVLIGSDGSNDLTNKILQNLQYQYPSLKIYLFPQRAGKSKTLNFLVKESKNEILLMTDAKVRFAPHVIFQLAKHFKNPEMGIVGGNIVNKKYHTNGISLPEKIFMSREIKTKYNEGKIYRSTIGVYGACYAVRKNLYKPFPESLTVDDFYQNMHILEEGKHAIIEINALCFENVPNRLSEEFRRKTRISVGNFQNLLFYKHLLLPFKPISFCFISHKIIRWFGPIILILLFSANILLLQSGSIYFYLLVCQLLLITIPIIDFFLHNIHCDIVILRLITHFYLMNLALLIGFVKYLKGEKLNVWEPTKREI